LTPSLIVVVKLSNAPSSGSIFALIVGSDGTSVIVSSTDSVASVESDATLIL